MVLTRAQYLASLTPEQRAKNVAEAKKTQEFMQRTTSKSLRGTVQGYSSGMIGVAGVIGTGVPLPKTQTLRPPTQEASTQTSPSTNIKIQEESIRQKAVNLAQQVSRAASYASLLTPFGAIGASSLLSDKIKQNYKSIDLSLGGYLPGGASRLEAIQNKGSKSLRESKALTSTQVAVAKEDLNRQQQLADIQNQQTLSKSEQKMVDDLVTQSWYEKLGLFDSQQEQTFQDALLQKKFFEQINPLVDQTLPLAQQYSDQLPSLTNALQQPLPQLPDSTGESFLSKAGSYVPWIILAGLGIYALSKRRS